MPTPDHGYPMLCAAALREPGEPLAWTCELFPNRMVALRGFVLELTRDPVKNT